MWNQIGRSNFNQFLEAIIYLQFNSVRMLVIQLVGLDEIKFDTGENFCPRKLTLQSFGPFFSKNLFSPLVSPVATVFWSKIHLSQTSLRPVPIICWGSLSGAFENKIVKSCSQYSQSFYRIIYWLTVWLNDPYFPDVSEAALQKSVSLYWERYALWYFPIDLLKDFTRLLPTFP